MRRIAKKSVLFGFALALAASSVGRTQDMQSLIGVPPHDRMLPVRFGQADLDTGNLHLEIPLYSATERGLAPNTLSLIYDSLFWRGTSVFGNLPLGPNDTVVYPSGTGWSLGGGDTNGGAIGALPGSATIQSCGRSGDTGAITINTSWNAVDSHGTEHSFLTYTVYNNCTFANSNTHDTGTSPQSSGGSYYAQDGTGYSLTVQNDGITASVVAPSGMQPAMISMGSGNNMYYLSGSESPNGNVYGVVGPGIVNQAYTATDEIGGPQGFSWDNVGNFCPGFNFAIQHANDVVSNQPYTSQGNITCTGTLPAYDSSTGTSATATYKFVFEYILVSTPIPPSGWGFYSGGMWVLKSVALPGNLGSYQFSYDSGTSGMHLGSLMSITLPTGGTVQYQYNWPGVNLPLGQSITPWITSVTDAGGSTTIAYQSPSASCGGTPYPEVITFPPHPATPGSAATIQDQRTIDTACPNPDWGYGPFTITDKSGSTAVRSVTESRDSKSRITSVSDKWLATGDTHTVTYNYIDNPNVPGYNASNGNTNLVVQENEYDNGTPIRTLNTQYLGDTSSIQYVSKYNMLTYPLSQTLLDGFGHQVAQTTYGYDDYVNQPLTVVTGASGHDDSRGASYTARGNATTVTRYVSSSLSPVVTRNFYDTLGNLVKSIDGNGGVTQYSYVDNYLDSTCVPSETATYAFPTKVTDAMRHVTTTAYYTCNRVPGQVQSPNDIAANRTGTTTTFDLAGRPICTNLPDGGQSCTSYPNPNEVGTSTKINSTTSDTVKTLLDSWGRATNLIDSGAGTEVDTSYDTFGRKNCVTNPYPVGGTVAPSTCYTYDVLSRTTGVQYPTGASQSYLYSGRTTTVTDPNGNQTISKSDGEGRLILVKEPNGNSTTATMETDYGYDVLNNLTSVTQWGGTANSTTTARNRAFAYDGLSRLVKASNPETGTVCYGTWVNSQCVESYDANGNLRAKTDARGLQTSYTYDHMNRLLGKVYSAPGNTGGNDPTNTVLSCYQYDVSTALNGIGLLSNAWTQSSSGPSSQCPSSVSV